MEARVLELVFPTDTNPMGQLFGGAMVAWMDKTAAYAAMRRARGTAVTAAIDKIEFKVPVHQGELVELVARVTDVGTTSLKVHVEAFVEDVGGAEPRLCTSGDFTMVAVNVDGRPIPVPPEVERADD